MSDLSASRGGSSETPDHGVLKEHIMDIELNWKDFVLEFRAKSKRAQIWMNSKFGTSAVFVHCSSDTMMREVGFAGLTVDDCTIQLKPSPCSNCQVPLWRPGRDGMCRSCTKFLDELLPLDEQALERKLLEQNWSDNCFGVFCLEYTRRGLHMPA